MDLHLSSGKTDPAVPLRGLKSTLAGSGQGVRLLWTSMDTPRSDRDIVARNTFHRQVWQCCGGASVVGLGGDPNQRVAHMDAQSSPKAS